MRIVSLSVVVAIACGPSGTSTSSTTAPESELKILMLATAVERADTALIADLFWPEATYDDFANQLTYQGILEIVGYLTSAHEWGDDIYMNMGRINTGSTMAVGEWIFSAVQNRPMGDQVPFVTGREVVLNGATIIELEGGRIMRAADYVDTAPLTLRLGGRRKILDADRQTSPSTTSVDKPDRYHPLGVSTVGQLHPLPYSQYNWER